jgi:hypothetical protein
MKNNPDYFDTSDYPKDHPLYSDKNKKVIGKLKDELNGIKILEYICLRSKMYSYRTENSVSKKLKGNKKTVLKKISFEDYKNCLFNQKEYFHRQKAIRSRKHDIFTEEIKNKSLSWKDDKRHLIPNSTDRYISLWTRISIIIGTVTLLIYSFSKYIFQLPLGKI